MKLRVRKTSHQATFTQRGAYNDDLTSGYGVQSGFVRIKGRTISGEAAHTCQGELIFWPNATGAERVKELIPEAVR